MSSSYLTSQYSWKWWWNICRAQLDASLISHLRLTRRIGNPSIGWGKREVDENRGGEKRKTNKASGFFEPIRRKSWQFLPRSIFFHCIPESAESFSVCLCWWRIIYGLTRTPAIGLLHSFYVVHTVQHICNWGKRRKVNWSGPWKNLQLFTRYQ